jgi:hypothetical protein
VIASTSALAGLGGLIGLIIILSLYMLPTIIGWQRKVINIGSVAAINLLLGWTLIGWCVALAMALRTNPPHAYDQYWQPQQPPRAMPAPGWYPDPQGMGQRWWDGQRWTDQTTGDRIG